MTSRDKQSLARPVALVGMMGAGKTAIGRKVAQRLGARFVDADAEIEAAAGCSIADIFAEHGEAYFRDGERRVIARLLDEGPCVLAPGGGAFTHAPTRELLKARAVTVWLKADFETLWGRVARRSHRPLLQTDDPQGTLKRLLAERDPVYAEADVSVDTGGQSKDAMARRVIAALAETDALADGARVL